MIFTYNPTITGDDLTRYGKGLDTLCTTNPTELLQRAELESNLIDSLLRDVHQAIDTVLHEVREL